MDGGDPLGEDLPGERRIASYRGQELRLTDLRVVYHGQGLARHERWSLRLGDLTAVGIGRRLHFAPVLMLIPLAIFILGFIAGLMAGDEGPFVTGSFLALFTLPIPWLGYPLALRFVTPGATLKVRVRRRDVQEALTFLKQVELAQEAVRGKAVSPAAVPTVGRFA